MDVSKLAPYAKTVVAVAGLVILAANACIDGVVESSEMIEIITAAAVALGVYQVPNRRV